MIDHKRPPVLHLISQRSFPSDLPDPAGHKQSLDMEHDGWKYGEKEDGLALNRQPVAPNETESYMKEHKGRTKAGKR